MKNPELFEFIKNQSLAGKSREEISNLLYPQGWTDKDIAEAFNNMSSEVVGTENKTITEKGAYPTQNGEVDDDSSGYTKSFSRGLLVLGIFITIVGILSLSVDFFVYAMACFSLAWGVSKKQQWAWILGQVFFVVLIISPFVLFYLGFIDGFYLSVVSLIPLIVLGYFIKGRNIKKVSSKSLLPLVVTVLAVLYVSVFLVWFVCAHFSDDCLYFTEGEPEPHELLIKILDEEKGDESLVEARFNFEDLKEGIIVGGLELIKLSYYTEADHGVGVPTIPFSENNFYAVFSGQVELEGRFKYFEKGTMEHALGPVCFYPDADSVDKLPQLYGHNSTFFCFRNYETAQETFAPEGNSGKAIVIVDEYRYTRLPSVGSSSANLVSVIISQ